MKEKILQAIRTQIVDKSGKTSISDKTLSSYVDAIAAQITDESQIATAIVPYVGVLKEFQLNINTVAAQAAEDAKKTIVPPFVVPEPIVPPIDKPLTMEDLKAFLSPFTEKINTFETQTKAEKRTSEIGLKAKEFGIPASFVSKFNVPEDANLDTYFTELRQEFTNIGYEGNTAPEDGSQPNKDSSALADQIAGQTKIIVEQTKK